jgi:hypothetical protein
MNKNPKVWVIKEQLVRNAVGSNPMDYTPAMTYGEIEFVTRSDLPLHPRSTALEHWALEVKKFVLSYDPKIDYIVTTGQPTSIFAVGWALGQAGKTPRFLVWRREENRYIPVNFEVQF